MTHKPDEYPKHWHEIASTIKTQAKWQCENCKHKNDRTAGRVLTVHHLNGIKADCRPDNLVALCQVCHLRIQAQYKPGMRWLLGKPKWAEKRNL